MDCILAQHVGVEAFPLFGVFFIALAVLVIVPIKLLISCMIFHKAGYADSWFSDNVFLKVNDKGERKATGSYYTPDHIVKYMLPTFR